MRLFYRESVVSDQGVPACLCGQTATATIDPPTSAMKVNPAGPDEIAIDVSGVGANRVREVFTVEILAKTDLVFEASGAKKSRSR